MSVTRVELEKRGPFAAGRAFGGSGPYEYLTGVLHFASDPKHAANKAICDLNLAPTNGQGLVEHRAQFHLLKPIEPMARGRVLVDSVNRGNFTAVPTFNSAPRRTDGSPDIDAGNGFLFRHGYSVLAIGVQWDPPESPERIRAWYPEALENGQLEQSLEQLGTIRNPVLLLNGEHDLILLPYAIAMKNAIPGARLEVVHGQGHELPLSDPAEANPLMLAFLQQR